MDIFSNPTLLIVLAVVALMMFSGGGSGLNLTDMLLALLRALKLIPPVDPPESRQLFDGYTSKAWELLAAGYHDEAQSELESALAAASDRLAAEQTIEPKSIVDKLKEFMKSPIIWVVIAAVVFLVMGQSGGCTPKPPV